MKPEFYSIYDTDRQYAYICHSANICNIATYSCCKTDIKSAVHT